MQLTRRHFGFSALASLCGACFGSLFPWPSRSWAKALAAADQSPAGPLVGHTTAHSSSLWMYTPSDALVEVLLSPEDGDGEVRSIQAEPISTEGLEVQGAAWKADLTGLEPLQRYRYQFRVDGELQPEHAGSFQTAPRNGAPAKFRLGLTSCMKIIKPQDSWQHFLDDEPTLHLTLGDTVYADTTNPAIQWRHHLQYRQSPLFAQVIRAMPTYALWDDHDFGPNNSDGTSKGKEASLSGWKRVWLNPGAGTPELPGAFFRFAWGDVEFFVVDGRYHRSPDKAPDDQHKTMLGDAQFAWLVEGLKNSSAKFKVVASGSPLDHSLHDGWRIYAHARRQFFDAIKENRIDGVIYLSGSLHNSLAWEHHESDRVGYPLVEVISSGIANSKKLSYATIDFDTTRSDPTMSVRIVRKGGKLHQQATWRLSQLSQV